MHSGMPIWQKTQIKTNNSLIGWALICATFLSLVKARKQIGKK